MASSSSDLNPIFQQLMYAVVESHIHQVHLSIDHALAVSYRRKLYDGNTAYVAHISLVKGVPFYGYHVGYDFFLKIYLLNPLHMTRLADLLRQGAILKTVIQPYESHMQYLAQWMCDYNLYGCSYIDCSKVKFRSPVPSYLDMNCTSHHWHDQTIVSASISDPEKILRQSHCSIEVDVCVEHIANRLDVKSRPIHHDFIERKCPVASDEKLVQSMASLWRDETRRRKARMGEIADGSSPFPDEVLVSVSADPRYSQQGGWIHESEYADKVQLIIEEEANQSDGKKVDFDDFVTKEPFADQIRTSLESVEDLFPKNLAQVALSQHTSHQLGSQNHNPNTALPDVDESRLLSYEEDEYLCESDEDLERELDVSQRIQVEMAEEQAEQPANQVADEMMYDNDYNLERKSSVEKKKDIRIPNASGGPHSFNSSDEFAAIGIRSTGDYNHLDQDEFDIPIEFTSEVSAETAKELADLEPKHKRQKIDHTERPRYENTSANPVKALKEVAEDINGLQDSEMTQSSANNSEHGSIHPKYHKYKTLSSWQGPITGNKTLSFPIVKDPQDPKTILKLSQNSSGHAEASEKPNSKTVSFASSKQPGAGTPNLSTNGLATSTLSPKQTPQLSLCIPSIRSAFDISANTRTLCIREAPPLASEVTFDLKHAKSSSVIYKDAHYSNEKDVPERAREYAGKEFRIESVTLPFLPDFDSTGLSPASLGEKPRVVVDKAAVAVVTKRRAEACRLRSWEFEASPPTQTEVQAWLDEEAKRNMESVDKEEDAERPNDKAELSQVDGPTQKNRHGFKYSQRQKSTSVQHETQYMSTMSLEIHVNTRGSLVPNPEEDEIECIFWCLQSDDDDLEVNGTSEGTHVGILVLSEGGGLAHKISQHTAVEVDEETSELDLIIHMVGIVRSYDPDILTGYEVHGGSWGYMIERARCKYDYNLCDEFSRMKSESHGRYGKEDDRWGFNHTSTIRVTGRHMINIWRAMRGELNLLQYTMENVVFQLCHRRIPHYAYHELTAWYSNGRPNDLAKVVEYYVSRVQLDVEILEQNELVPRTSEQARLLGVDFFSVFSRGSQFKVESLMFRIAKPENFLLPSPSRKQVGQQNALECLPLVMEPQSAFFNSPLLVLDFQSLYPSVMIAYNYCYSTFLGRVVEWRGQNKMGFSNYERQPRLLGLLRDQINIAPNGIVYAKPEIRKSLLAKMLGEILETRVMVKSGMKVDKDDKTLQRLLNNRQLALKLIANVTYGYTSASFSGRMPCSEIADSIVQTGRETLEKAIALIHSVEKWGAEVVYGDTDSLFVYLRGRTKDEAFKIGREIAKTVTDMNPRPVKLKFEKVYLPCVLLAKKRYVGFKYESEGQKEPEFDAKGIETVRRDGTPAEQKTEEKALKILFRTADLSQVKTYFQQQCSKIMRGKISIQDFCFAKEVKLGTYSDKGLPPPGALISTRRMLDDPRAEPQYGERVPYVVITGAPGARLVDRCVAPEELLRNDNNELDAEYYISKNLIPPLERIFNLVGANVRQWYDEMPKHQRIRRVETGPLYGDKDLIVSKKTLESYMRSSTCLVCHEKLEEESAICARCVEQADSSLLMLRARLNKAENKAVNLERVCRSCAGLAWAEDVKCDSKDCPVFYTRTRHMAELRSARRIAEPVMDVLKELGTNILDW